MGVLVFTLVFILFYRIMDVLVFLSGFLLPVFPFLVSLLSPYPDFLISVTLISAAEDSYQPSFVLCNNLINTDCSKECLQRR